MRPLMFLSLAMVLFLLVDDGIVYFTLFSFVTGFGLDPKRRVNVKCRAYNCQLFAGGRTVTEGAWAVSTRNRGKSAIWVTVGKKSCITLHESVNSTVQFTLQYFEFRKSCWNHLVAKRLNHLLGRWGFCSCSFCSCNSRWTRLLRTFLDLCKVIAVHGNFTENGVFLC